MDDVVINECLACGRPYTEQTEGSDGRFCSVGCHQGFDAGCGPYDPDYAGKNNPRWYSLPMGPHGFVIACKGCGKNFDSNGLRCCSPACEGRYRERQETIALMAEVGGERSAKCLQCDGGIPNWLNPGTPQAKRVPKSRKFCSATCKERYRAQNGVPDAEKAAADA